MITLHSFGPKFGIEDPSSFVLKVATYMRMVGIEYQSKSDTNNLQVAPKGKLPFIYDNNKLIADSYFIIEHLKAAYGDPLDEWLSDQQKASSHLLAKSLDENLYWCVVYSRWMSDDVWPLLKQAFFAQLPFPIKFVIPNIARKSVQKNLVGHGLGRHSAEEVKQIAVHSLQSLSDLLADNEYFFGDRVCAFDATAYAHLAQMILVDIDHELNQEAKKFTNLVAYCHRIDQQYFAKDSKN